MKKFCLVGTLLLLAAGANLHADDWPEYRGAGRTGVWNETGTLNKFPAGGLKVRWRVPIKAGMSGPAVAGGRVFITDFDQASYMRGTERVLALDEKTGKILWTQSWPADYAAARIGFMPYGPAATPTVDGDRVYALGRAGAMLALRATTGEILWQRDFVKEFKMGGGTNAAPVIDGNLIIAFVSGEGIPVAAFDKMTGKEVWRALPELNDIGGATPVIITHAGVRQLLVWHTGAVVSMNPQTGKIYWEAPFKTYGDVNPGIPVKEGNLLMISTFNLGSMMLQLDDNKPGAKMIWRARETASDVDTDGLHSLFSPPIIKNGFIYGICSYGQLRALGAKTGERIWETQSPMVERARFSSAFLVQNGDKYFINNDRGELIIARLTPEKYEELDRTLLVKPTTTSYNRRQLKVVSWMHPAFANKTIYARNDEEIIAASLAAE